jgi:hypothetical protein
VFQAIPNTPANADGLKSLPEHAMKNDKFGIAENPESTFGKGSPEPKREWPGENPFAIDPSDISLS